MGTPNLLLLLHLLLSSTLPVLASPLKTTYIVHVSEAHKPIQFAEQRLWYEASLHSVSDSPELLYTYETVAHGFSARLTAAEAEALSTHDGIVSVIPEMRYELHTTHSPEFLGLSTDAVLSRFSELPSSGGSGVIVGVLDTGAWPESKSYSDDGFGPVPSTWKGTCEEGKAFPATSCNRKLVGARFFCKGYEAVIGPIDPSTESRSPLDKNGHGTHTSTTVAGSAVHNASLFGYASGTARGMALQARVAIYKVCWSGGCFSSDILAAMDKAVVDGVNVLSMSLGGGQSDYYRDSIAIGAFAAMEKGILVSCSAGNGGPGSHTLNNMAPWVTTVGAGTLDRDFPAYILLGNGKNYTGASLYSGKPLNDTETLLGLVYAGNVSNGTNGNLCMTGTLIPDKVAGKIVLCDRGITARVQKGYVVKQAGGAGMILANTIANGEELVADSHLLPGANVGQKVGDDIRSYVSSDPSARATIVFAGTKLKVKPAPVVAAFSSRGPNTITPGILKPDMIAPGVNILAGWSGLAGPTGLPVDDRRTNFSIVSGTSMSCPHVSGLAALLKSTHPDWSPAAVKSALMTTAYGSYRTGGKILDVSTGQPATPFDLGAGHVDPVRALDPGLVYDASTEDYLNFLCALNYTSLQITAISRKNYTCDAKNRYVVEDLNYPSFAVAFATESGKGGGSGKVSTIRHTRTLTNVGVPGTYKASVSTTSSEEVEVKVDPTVLGFKKVGEKLRYTVSFTAASQPSGTSAYGRLEWSDGRHVVRSPIAITWT